MNWIYPLYICEFALFFLAFFLSKKDIMAPSAIMCVMFILSTTVAILASDHINIKMCAESFSILVAGIFTFVVSVALFQRVFQRKVTHAVKEVRLQELQDWPFCAVHVQGWLIIVAIMIDVVIVAWYLRETLRTLGGFGGVVRGAIVSRTVISTSFGNAQDQVLYQLVKVVKALGYISGFILIQRILAKEKGSFETAGFAIMMIMGLTTGLVTTSRGEILQFLSALLAEYNILWHQKNGWNRNLSWKLIRLGILCIVVGIPLFYYSVLWLGRTALKSMRTITEVVNIYVGYPIYLFDLYVKKPVPPGVFGQETLTGVNVFLGKFLGMNILVQAPAVEFRYANGYFLGNVYTFFRRPLHDFGFAGMLIFTAAVALLFSWIYYGKIKWKPRSIKTDCWSMVYGYLFYWIVLSSIAQYSQSYVSVSTLTLLILIAIGYHILTGVRLTSEGLKYIRHVPAKKRVRRSWTA